MKKQEKAHFVLKGIQNWRDELSEILNFMDEKARKHLEWWIEKSFKHNKIVRVEYQGVFNAPRRYGDLIGNTVFFGHAQLQDVRLGINEYEYNYRIHTDPDGNGHIIRDLYGPEKRQEFHQLARAEDGIEVAIYADKGEKLWKYGRIRDGYVIVSCFKDAPKLEIDSRQVCWGAYWDASWYLFVPGGAWPVDLIHELWRQEHSHKLKHDPVEIKHHQIWLRYREMKKRIKRVFRIDMPDVTIRNLTRTLTLVPKDDDNFFKQNIFYVPDNLAPGTSWGRHLDVQTDGSVDSYYVFKLGKGCHVEYRVDGEGYADIRFVASADASEHFSDKVLKSLLRVQIKKSKHNH